MIVMAVVKTAAPLTVTLDSGDAELPAQRLATYAPVAADRVAVDTGPPLVVLGKVVP